MHGDDESPVAADDFPEFASPPRHKPHPSHERKPRDAERPVGNKQDEADDVIARIKRERAEREGR
ncbi:hypothetical protein ABIE44_000945 [Marmoricola sp. OAE513]|uniref:hypothetical protein n=1 Tax=Marmoricola sp. OAE513 TaxID=2817894 RepID=UPI001AE30DF4